jgi:DNA-binding NtrC family response regulator/tetratricopeptide (TPR) repeat protein
MDPHMDNRGRPVEGDSAPPRESTEFERLLAMADLDIGLDAHAEALNRLMALRDFPVPRSPEERFALERRIALCLDRLGRINEARAAARAILDTAPKMIAPVERARCLLVAGKAALELGYLAEARADALSALEALAGGKPLEEAGSARNLLGTVAYRSGQTEIAREQFEKSLEVFRKLGDLQHLAGSYMNLGNVHKLRCDFERAAEHYHVGYYLATTLGDMKTVAGAAQNLGIILTKTGRYREARTYLDRSMKLASETGDLIRALRARLAIAKLDRLEVKISQARFRIESCHSAEMQILPEREHCLVLLEEALLDLDDGDIEHARHRSAELRLRVEAMAPKGDLMVDVLLLEADIAAAERRWDDVERNAANGIDLARTNRDRPTEEGLLLRQAIAWAHKGRKDAADASLRGLLERHRSRGEWPAYADALKARARIALHANDDPESALDYYREAMEVYRRIDVPRAEALSDAERIGCLIRLGSRDEAATRIDELRTLDDGDFPSLTSELDRLSESLRRSEDDERVDAIDGLKVHARLEEILSASGSAWDRLPEILGLLKDALEVDGIAFLRPRDGDVEAVAAIGIDILRGKKSVPAAALGLDPHSTGAATLKSNGDLSLGAGRGNVSILTIPIAARGSAYLLHLRRIAAKGRGPLGRAERNYAMILAAEITRALEIGTPDSEEDRLARGTSVADVITQNPRMLKILDLIRRVGDTDLTVLLQGETGTGKKLLAHAIHRASSRRVRPMVTVDCAALPDSLLEAELFGYRKGAFTGANQDRTGLLAEANGGTVFLDEIDKAGLAVQRRFLHLLDSGEVRPVGSTSYVKLDVRIVCATSSSDLRREVAEGSFIKDLYYRLNDISIEIPPLRERPDDILLLAGCFIETYAGQVGHRIRGMSAAFRRILMGHNWPGNVRELEKAIRRAVTLADDDVLLTPELLPGDVLGDLPAPEEDDGDNLRRKVEVFEQRVIEQTLLACQGNKSRAAQVLGLSRKGLKGKMARLRMARQSPSDD